MKKLVIILGTRAELIKTFPVMLALQKAKQDYTFVHTGQHSLGPLCSLFGVKEPDVVLTKPPEESSKFFVKTFKAIFWNLFIVPKIWNSLRKIKNLDYVMYHGDTMSTASAAFASSRLLNWRKKYGNIHLEAGLRSKSLFEPFPEEISRRICDKFSDVLLAVSKGTEKNLKKEKRKGLIWNIGNTIVDSAEWAYRKSKEIKVKVPKKDFILVTIHRHENIKKRKRLEKVVEILRNLPIQTIFPLHDNTKKQMEKFGLYKKLISNKNIKIVKLKGYVDFIGHLGSCKLLITDGGSIQEESLVFKKPCILLRELTERDEGLFSGLNFLNGLDIKKAKKTIKRCLSLEFNIPNFKNPYGDKGVSEKLVEYLLK